jgi:hypothetical protein
LQIETSLITCRCKKGRLYVDRIVSFAYSGGHCSGCRAHPGGNSHLSGQKIESGAKRKTDSLNRPDLIRANAFANPMARLHAFDHPITGPFLMAPMT